MGSHIFDRLSKSIVRTWFIFQRLNVRSRSNVSKLYEKCHIVIRNWHWSVSPQMNDYNLNTSKKYTYGKAQQSRVKIIYSIKNGGSSSIVHLQITLHYSIIFIVTMPEYYLSSQWNMSFFSWSQSLLRDICFIEESMCRTLCVNMHLNIRRTFCTTKSDTKPPITYVHHQIAYKFHSFIHDRLLMGKNNNTKAFYEHIFPHSNQYFCTYIFSMKSVYHAVCMVAKHNDI